MKKRVLSMLMTLALCLTLLPAPAWAEEDTPEIGATVQQEQQEAQQEAPAAEPSTILEQAAENGIAAQNGGGSTVENAVAEVTVNGSTTTQYTDIDAAFAAAQEADSATVKLLADVTISHDDYSGIALKKGNITLDLNGKTLSKSKRDDNWFYAKNAVFWLLPPEATTKDEFLAALRMPVRLTVQDSSADENGKIVQPNGGPAVTATLNTILTVNGGTIENASSVDPFSRFASFLRQFAFGKRCPDEDDSGVAGTQRFLYHREYLFAFGLRFQGFFGRSDAERAWNGFKSGK